MSPIGLAVIGAGYWGPNLVRTALATPALQLEWLCDLDEQRARSVLGRYLMVRPTTSSTRTVLVRPGGLCSSGSHPGRHAFRPGPRGARGGQARAGGEAADASTVADGEKLVVLCAGKPPRILDVRPHLLLYPGRAADPGADPERGDRGHPVRGLDPGELGTGTARCRRAVGPRSARLLDPGLRPARGRQAGGGQRPQQRPGRAPGEPAWPICRSGCPPGLSPTCT